MYRSAHNNQDKTAILTYNNPLPDFSDRNGEEGPMRYYPSWIGEEEEVVDAPAYKKWLEKLPDIDSLAPMETDETEAKPIAGDSIDHLPATTSKKSTKLSFLTEEDATCEGTFWASRPEKQNDGKEKETILLSKRTSTFQNKPTRKRTSQEKKNERSLTAPSSTASLRQQKPDTSWQPLSLTALTEYKPTVDTSRGAGDFAYGSTNMWRPILANDP
ncbi:uncharacterized protein LOC117116470 [Anneissia japonica]|uniref:uncharacterized protein LOC117116470 n=1 Tax=Anneissia japonica TaxID=1529436 RepID=UPI0014258CCD|nr:uncharacterized protein LOC117116470 [Anneissia japonica]